MKKVISFALALSLAALSLFGCEKPAFDFGKTVARLEENGYTQTTEYNTRDKIEYISSELNRTIQEAGETLWVQVERYARLTKDDDRSLDCTLIEFATEEQARGYVALVLSRRQNGDTVKIARGENTVVITNATDVQKNLDLEFK